MHVAVRARRFLARRPWVYWLVVALIATTMTLVVHAQLGAVDDARGSWGRTRRVLVADVTGTGRHLRGDRVELPEAMIPDGALTELAGRRNAAPARRAGEVLVDLDIGTLPGPAALADPGTVGRRAVGSTESRPDVGLDVQIVADGLVVAEVG